MTIDDIDAIKALLIKKREIDPVSGCWTPKRAKSAYLPVFVSGVYIGIHRLALWAWKGVWVDGTHLWTRHDCDNGHCFNPAHLRSGTPGDNVRDTFRRGRRPQKNSRPTCRNGHPYTPENTYVHPKGNYRRCRECHRLRELKRHRENR